MTHVVSRLASSLLVMMSAEPLYAYKDDASGFPLFGGVIIYTRPEHFGC